MAYQNPYMDTLARGGQVANQGMSVAGSMMNGIMNAMNNTSNLSLKLSNMLRTEEARKVEQSLQTQKILQDQVQFTARQKLLNAEISSRKEIAANTNAYNYASLNDRMTNTDLKKQEFELTKAKSERAIKAMNDFNSPTTAPSTLSVSSSTSDMPEGQKTVQEYVDQYTVEIDNGVNKSLDAYTNNKITMKQHNATVAKAEEIKTRLPAYIEQQVAIQNQQVATKKEYDKDMQELEKLTSLKYLAEDAGEVYAHEGRRSFLESKIKSYQKQAEQVQKDATTPKERGDLIAKLWEKDKWKTLKEVEKDADYILGGTVPSRLSAGTQQQSNQIPSGFQASRDGKGFELVPIMKRGIADGSNDAVNFVNSSFNNPNIHPLAKERIIKAGLASPQSTIQDMSRNELKRLIPDKVKRGLWEDNSQKELFRKLVTDKKIRWDKNLLKFVAKDLNDNSINSYATSAIETMNKVYKPDSIEIKSMHNIKTQDSIPTYWLADIFGSTKLTVASMAKKAGIYDIDAIENDGYDYGIMALGGVLAAHKLKDVWDYSYVKNFSLGFFGVTLDNQNNPETTEVSSVKNKDGSVLKDKTIKKFIVPSTVHVSKARPDMQKRSGTEMLEELKKQISKTFKANPQMSTNFKSNFRSLGSIVNKYVDMNRTPTGNGEDRKIVLETDNNHILQNIPMRDIETGKIKFVDMSFKDASNLYLSMIGFL